MSRGLDCNSDVPHNSPRYVASAHCRCHYFDALELIESELEVEEVNAVDVVQDNEDSEVVGSKWRSDTCGRRCAIGHSW